MSTEMPSPTSTRGSVRFRATLGGDLSAGSDLTRPLTTVNVGAGGLLARMPEPVKPTRS